MPYRNLMELKGETHLPVNGMPLLRTEVTIEGSYAPAYHRTDSRRDACDTADVYHVKWPEMMSDLETKPLGEFDPQILWA